MKVGIVCPYSLDVPGGVQAHVMDLARALRRLGHEVDVLAPADEDSPVPPFVTPAGRALGIPYNGSVARLSFGPRSFAKVRRWIRDHDFDVLHLHEPTAPSLSMLALMVADGPIVATFHTSTPRSRALSAFQLILQPFLEKITARIAVSALARRVQVQHLGGDAVEIPNGVDVSFFAEAEPLLGYPRTGGTVGFVGRFTEPRKGMAVLLGALRQLVPDFPDLQLLVVGRGDPDDLRAAAGPELADRIVLLGQADDKVKAQALRSMDVYCAPNTGGESFGVILTEAMAQVGAVLILLCGVLVVITVLKLSFQISSAAATIGGLLLAVLLAIAFFAVSQIYLLRAQSVHDLEDSPFTIIPILSILFRASGEAYAVGALAFGVGGCLFTWLSGMSPTMLLSGLGGFMPPIPGLNELGGQSFVSGLIFLVTMIIAGFTALVVFYALSELVVVLVDIAINVRRLVKAQAVAVA